MPAQRSSKAKSSSNKTVARTTGNLNDRTITIIGKDLGRNVDLMCTFEKLTDKKLGYDQQQVCWKVIRLGPKGNQAGKVKYTANTAFFVPQADAGNVVFPLISGQCSTSQKVTLTAEGQNLSFTDPVAGADGMLEAVNGVNFATDIGIGFTDDDGDNLSPGLIFKRVGAGASVKAQFTPVLKIYATSNYQENEILRGEVEYPLIWSKNLMELDSSTRLRISIDPVANVPKIRVE